jgi:hypothetical protein
MGTPIPTRRDSTINPMTTIYKFLNVENHHVISEQMFAYIRDHSGLLVLNPPPQFWTDLDIKTVLHHVPELRKLLKRNSLTPQQIAVIIINPDGYPHDELHVDKLDPYVRMLWPVKNCAGSRTKFYDVPRSFLRVDPPGKDSTNEAFYPTVERDWRFLGEVELSSPIVFDASIAHSVHCAPHPYAVPAHTDWFRITFTVGFDRSLPISNLVSAWPDSLNYSLKPVDH